MSRHFYHTPQGVASTLSRRTARLYLAGAALASCAPVWAQTLPPSQTDPAAIQRQELERRRQTTPAPATQATPALTVDTAPAPATSAAPVAPGTRFVLRDLQFGTSVFLTDTELAALAAEYVGKDADFNTLTHIVNILNAMYRQHGVLTGRAVLPPQRIANGVVKIDLIEARVGLVQVQGNVFSRADYMAGMVAADPGQTLDPREVEERIQRFNRAGNVQLEGSLRPGASFGLTDLMLEVREPARYQARVFANNEGSQSVGREQIGIDTALNGLAGIGDRLSLYATRARGATLGSLSYALPFNSWGGHISASYSVSATDVISGPYRALGINGKSKTMQLAAIQPVLQEADWWFDLAASVGRTHSDNQIDGAPLSDTTINNQTMGGTLASTSDQRSLNFTFSATHAKASALGTADRSFMVRQASASWVENLGPGQFGLLRGNVQDTNNVVLAPTLLFQVGGNSSVRGYDVGVLSGDTGYLMSMEFHRTLANGIGGYLFHDYGSVRTRDLPRESAHSVGAGLEAQSGSVSGNVVAGYALSRVQPDQRHWRVTAELSYAF